MELINFSLSYSFFLNGKLVGETDKTHLIVAELPLQATSFTAEAFIKVGKSVIASRTRDIKVVADVYYAAPASTTFNCAQGQASPILEGQYIGDNIPVDIKVDDEVRIIYLVNIYLTEMSDRMVKPKIRSDKEEEQLKMETLRKRENNK